MAEANRKDNSPTSYWGSLLTLLVVSLSVFAALCVRPDTRYTSDDTISCGLLVMWHFFLVLFCVEYPASHIKRESHIKSAVILGSLVILSWFLTVVFAVVLTFVSPYFRENAIYIFCGVFTSMIIVAIALYLFFRRDRVLS